MATKTYEQLQQQIAALQAEADKVRRKELEEVIGRIREAVTYYGITAADLGLDTAPKARKAAAPAKPGRKAAAKKPPAVVAYRDEAGNSWVGRGKRPQWLRDALAAGRKLEDFKVKPEA